MNYWNQIPLIRLIIPFIIGIIAAVYGFPIGGFVYPAIAFLFLILLYPELYVRYGREWLFGSTLTLLLLFLGYQYTVLGIEKNNPFFFPRYLKQADMLAARLSEPVKEKKKSYKAEVEIYRLRKGGEWMKTNGKAVLYFAKDSLAQSLSYGDCILIRPRLSEISPPRNPSEFDYKRYLSYHNISYQGFFNKGDWHRFDSDQGSLLFHAAYAVRKRFFSFFRQNDLKGDELGVVSALLLGNKEELGDELRNAYINTGTIHVLAVSGMHVALIYLLLSGSLFFLDKFRWGGWVKAMLLLAFLWFYAVLTGLSPSVLRAATMFSFVVVGEVFRKQANVYNTLAASALLLLLVNPFIIMEVGFQLSYLAVIGILFVHPMIYRLWQPSSWILDKVWAIISISFAAQIATFPLGILYFHQFPVYFLLSNLIVIPLVTIIIYGVVILLLCFPIIAVAKVWGALLGYIVYGLNEMVQSIECFPYATLKGISITIWETIVIYFVIGLFLLFLTKRHIEYLYSTLTLIVVLLLFNIVEKNRQMKQRTFIVYDIPHTAAYNFIDGEKSFLLADTSLFKDENRMLFHIRHYWWDNGIGSLHTIPYGSDRLLNAGECLYKKDHFIGFYDKRIAFVDSTFRLPTLQPVKMKLDYLILSGNPDITIKKLALVFDCKKIIIDPTNSYYRTQRWVDESVACGIPCFSVKVSGAYMKKYTTEEPLLSEVLF